MKISGKFTGMKRLNGWLFFAAAICVLYLLRATGRFSIPSMMFVALFGLAFALLDVSDGLGIFALTLPMTLPNSIIRMTYIAITAYKLGKVRKLKASLGAIICVFVLIVIQTLNVLVQFNTGMGNGFENIVEFSVCLLVPLLWFSDAYSPEGKKRAIILFVVGLVVAYSYIVILTVKYRGILILFSTSRSIRLGLNLSSFLPNGASVSIPHPNQIATSSAIGIALMIRLMDEKQVSRIIGYLMCGALVFFMLLTKSRTGILCLAVIAAYYYLVISVRRKQFAKGIGILALFAVAVFLSWYVLPDVWDTILSRFTDADDITNGRISLSRDYISIWSSDFWCFLFGRGQLNYIQVSGVYEGKVLQSAHNAEVDILMSCGLLGLLAFVYLLSVFYSKSKRGISRRDIVMAVLPVILNIFIFQGGQYTTVMMYHIRFCFLMMTMGAGTVLSRKRSA